MWWKSWIALTSLSRWFIPTNVCSDVLYLSLSPDPWVRAHPPSCVQKKALKVFPDWSSLWTMKPQSAAISARVAEFAAPANSSCSSQWKVSGGSSRTWAGGSRRWNWGRLGLIEGCFNAVRGWQVGIITSYLFMQKTPWLTFNECSMRAGR